MDKLQRSLRRGAESSPSYRRKQPFLKRLFDRVGLSFRSVSQVPQADMLVDEETAILYTALQKAGKSPRFYDEMVDAFTGRNSTDYALVSLGIAEGFADKLGYERGLHGFDSAAKNVATRLVRSADQKITGRYLDQNWSTDAAERLDRADDLVRRYSIDGMNVVDAYKQVVAGLVSDVRNAKAGRYLHTDWFDKAVVKADEARVLNESHRLGEDTNIGYRIIVEGLVGDVIDAKAGRYLHRDWSERAVERAEKVRLLNGMYNLGVYESWVYGIVIDGLTSDVRDAKASRYLNPNWQDTANAKANRAMGLAVQYAPSRILELNEFFRDTGLTLETQSN